MFFRINEIASEEVILEYSELSNVTPGDGQDIRIHRWTQAPGWLSLLLGGLTLVIRAEEGQDDKKDLTLEPKVCQIQV